MVRLSALRRLALQLLAFVLLIGGLTVITASPAAASHFRFRDLTWQVDRHLPDGAGTVVELTMRIADRRSYYGGSMQLGSPFSASVATGDGGTELLEGEIVSVNPVDDWFIAEVRGYHQYVTAGPYTVSWESCCTLSTLRNSPNSSLRTTTVIDMRDGNTTAPVSLVSPIVNLPARQAAQSFRIPATDFDGHNVSFRLASQAESLVTQPPGLSIDERTGVVSWDTTGRPNGLWMVTAVLSDPAGAATMNTFLINLGGTASPPPVWVDPTPADRANFAFHPVTNDTDALPIVLAAEDPEGERVTITPLNSPPGFDCVHQQIDGQAVTSCAWRPDATGSYLVAFDAQDPTGASAGLRVYRLTTPRYVAFGDSYSSGEGALDPASYEEGTDGDTGGNGCRRASTAYPALLAGDEGVPATFQFVACSGARTWHFFEAQHPTGPGKVQPAQLDMARLGQDVELITLTIGGNDAMFSSIIKKCIGTGLIQAACSSIPQMSEWVVQDAFARLRGEQTQHGLGEDRTVALGDLYSEIIRNAPRARVVVMGYPQFFRTGGTYIMDCSGVTKADQLWVNEKVHEMNELLRMEALSLGIEFVNPTNVFEGHRLCEIFGGEDREWFRDIVPEWGLPPSDPASFHPDDDGHFAEYQLLLDVLDAPLDSFIMQQDEWRTFFVDVVGGDQAWLDLFARWPGSDVQMTVTSPSGLQYTRSNTGSARHLLGPTFESFRIPSPEQGRWKVDLFGADLGADGEPVTFTSQVRPEWNRPPIAVMTSSLAGETLRLDGSGSTDPEGGSLVDHHWIIRNEDGVVAELHGKSVEHTFDHHGNYAVTLRVEDESGKSGFVGSTEAIQVGSRYEATGFENPVGDGLNGVQAGRAVPLKWRLTEDGVPISEAGSFQGITSHGIECSTGQHTDAPMIGETPGASELKYHGDGDWQINWKTSQDWGGTCRKVRVRFDDGSALTAELAFK